MGTDLQIVDDDGVGDVVGGEVLLHGAHAGARDSDVHGELGGDRVEPEVQLEITGL